MIQIINIRGIFASELIGGERVNFCKNSLSPRRDRVFGDPESGSKFRVRRKVGRALLETYQREFAL